VLEVASAAGRRTPPCARDRALPKPHSIVPASCWCKVCARLAAGNNASALGRDQHKIKQSALTCGCAVMQELNTRSESVSAPRRHDENEGSPRPKDKEIGQVPRGGKLWRDLRPWTWRNQLPSRCAFQQRRIVRSRHRAQRVRVVFIRPPGSATSRPEEQCPHSRKPRQ